MPTKILFCSCLIPGQLTGGRRMLLRLVRGLDRQRYTPVVLMHARDELTRQLEAVGVRTIVLPLPDRLNVFGGKLLRRALVPQLLSLISLLCFTWRLARFIRRERVALVCCMNLRALLTVGPAARCLRLPVLWNIGLAPELKGRARLLQSAGLRLADKVVLESEVQRDRVFSSGELARFARKFTIIRKGIDAAELDERQGAGTGIGHLLSDLRRREAALIGTVSSITPRKGLHHLIEALGRLHADFPRLHCVIAGEPVSERDRTYHEELMRQAERLGLRNHVHFLGWVEAVADVLRQIDLFVLPSLNEGIPGAVKEAMLAERAVVATDVGGTAEALVHGETGLLVPAGDPAPLADAIRELLDDDSLREQMGRAGRLRSLQLFSPGVFIAAYERVFDTLMGQSRLQPPRNVPADPGAPAEPRRATFPTPSECLSRHTFHGRCARCASARLRHFCMTRADMLTSSLGSGQVHYRRRGEAAEQEGGLRAGRCRQHLRQRLERLLAAILLIPAIPLMLVTALLIRLTSRGPVLLRQTRVGQGGRTFGMYKFRSMVSGAERRTGPAWTPRDDPRITPVGRVLRKLHLDELPQLFNVLKGEMAIVGPRPVRPEIAELRLGQIPDYLERHALPPGMTGLAQVNAPPDYDLDSVLRKHALDLAYIRDAGLLLDARLLLCTLLKIAGLPAGLALRLLRVRRDAVPGEAVAIDRSYPAADEDFPRGGEQGDDRAAAMGVLAAEGHSAVR